MPPKTHVSDGQSALGTGTHSPIPAEPGQINENRSSRKGAKGAKILYRQGRSRLERNAWVPLSRRALCALRIYFFAIFAPWREICFSVFPHAAGKIANSIRKISRKDASILPPCASLPLREI
jgi:hypothetical protein